jgi:hypothetical protein
MYEGTRSAAPLTSTELLRLFVIMGYGSLSAVGRCKLLLKATGSGVHGSFGSSSGSGVALWLAAALALALATALLVDT